MRCQHCTEVIRPCTEGTPCTVRCLHDRPNLLRGETATALQLSGPLLACKGWVHAGPRDGWHLCDPFTSHTVLAAPEPEDQLLAGQAMSRSQVRRILAAEADEAEAVAG